MEHKFIIEVRLRHEPPTPVKGQPRPQQVNAVELDPKALQALLTQLPHVLAALQPKPTGQPPRPTGQPPRP